VQKAVAEGRPYADIVIEMKEAHEAEAAAILEKEKVTRIATAADEAATAAKLIQTEATKEASDANTNYLALLGQTQSALESFASKQSDLAQQRLDTEKQLADTPAWDTEKINGFKQKISEISQSESELQAQRDMDQKKFVQQQTEKLLAVDGLSKAEMEYLVQRGEDQGIYAEGTKKMLDEAMKAAADAAIEQKRQEEAVLKERQETFSNYGNSVDRTLGEQRAAVQLYIDKLGEIPTQIETIIKAVIEEIPPLTGGPTSAGFASVGVGQTIIYQIQNAFIGSDHALSGMEASVI